MILHYNPDTRLFVAECSFGEKVTVKAAGFRFCGGDCDPKYKCARCLGVNTKVTPLPPIWWTATPELAARLEAYADPAAKEALEATVGRQALSSAKSTDYVPPAPPGMVYRDFQAAGIEYVLDVWTRFKGALIADDMGLGKTVQALGLINADPSIRRVLIVCPKSLQVNWLREADRWLIPKQEPWRCYVAEESLPIPEVANLVVVNYDKLVGRPGQVVAPSLVAHGKWDLIVYDEAQYCKNPEAARTEVCLQGLPPSARRLLFLTGTPIENRPIEIYPIVHACAPQEFQFWAFAKRYADAHEEWIGARRQKRVWKFDGASNLEELNARLRGTIMVRRLKKDVLAELPAKVRQVVELPNDGVERMLTEESSFFEKHKDTLEPALEAGSFADAVENLDDRVEAAFSELSAIRHELGLAKADPALSWIEDALGNAQKMIVFAHHHDVIDLLVAGLEKFSPVKVDGRDSTEDRQEAVDRFQSDPECRVFIGQTSAAGVGLTLTAASTVVFVESDWVPGKISQAEDRVHRIGQTECVNVYHLVFDGSLDARMLQVILAKQAVQDQALDSEVALEVSGASVSGDSGATVTDEKPKKDWPVATDEERAAAKKALRLIAENCDGARKEDGAGFNKMDSQIGKSLAALPRPLSDGQVAIARRLAKKYHRQLPDDVKQALSIS